MKLLPIVPGCRAVVTHVDQSKEAKPFRPWQEVKALHLVPREAPCKHCKGVAIWAVDNGEWGICECCLMRIDGNDDQFRKEVARQQKPRQCVKAVHD